MFLVPLSVLLSTSMALAGCLLMNGVFFHGQTISAYYLMDYISPVTHRCLKALKNNVICGLIEMPLHQIILFVLSVANTGKRAFLIWTSILLFGNEVTFLSGLGTFIVILGVLLYNIALGIDARYIL